MIRSCSGTRSRLKWAIFWMAVIQQEQRSFDAGGEGELIAWGGDPRIVGRDRGLGFIAHVRGSNSLSRTHFPHAPGIPFVIHDSFADPTRVASQRP
jgi:hypothetical protein